MKNLLINICGTIGTAIVIISTYTIIFVFKIASLIVASIVFGIGSIVALIGLIVFPIWEFVQSKKMRK